MVTVSQTCQWAHQAYEHMQELATPVIRMDSSTRGKLALCGRSSREVRADLETKPCALLKMGCPSVRRVLPPSEVASQPTKSQYSINLPYFRLLYLLKLWFTQRPHCIPEIPTLSSFLHSHCINSLKTNQL